MPSAILTNSWEHAVEKQKDDCLLLPKDDAHIRSISPLLQIWRSRGNPNSISREKQGIWWATWIKFQQWVGRLLILGWSQNIVGEVPNGDATTSIPQMMHISGACNPHCFKFEGVEEVHLNLQRKTENFVGYTSRVLLWNCHYQSPKTLQLSEYPAEHTITNSTSTLFLRMPFQAIESLSMAIYNKLKCLPLMYLSPTHVEKMHFLNQILCSLLVWITLAVSWPLNLPVLYISPFLPMNWFSLHTR